MEKKLEFNDLDILLRNSQLSAVIRTMELERKRIAQDLHDDISSKLNVISLNCHLLKLPDLPQKDIQEITKNIIEYTSKALDSSKKMTYSLLPPVLDKFGLHAGIEELCSELIRKGGVSIQYENNLDFDFKENNRHIHIFRILQELFSNSIQHGKATSITVFFDKIDGKKTCRYSDNGIGFELNQLVNHQGLGMRNVVSRVAILEGNFSIESKMNNGVLVIFNF